MIAPGVLPARALQGAWHGSLRFGIMLSRQVRCLRARCAPNRDKNQPLSQQHIWSHCMSLSVLLPVRDCALRKWKTSACPESPRMRLLARLRARHSARWVGGKLRRCRDRQSNRACVRLMAGYVWGGLALVCARRVHGRAASRCRPLASDVDAWHTACCRTRLH